MGRWKKAVLFSMMATFLVPALSPAKAGPAMMRELAHRYYRWYPAAHPVAATDMGLHAYDGILDDLSQVSIKKRVAVTRGYLNALARLNPARWSVDDRIDYALFKSDLEGSLFFEWTLRGYARNPQIYTDLCSEAIFSILKKDYAPAPVRAAYAARRLRAVPALIANAKANLKNPVRLYAELAIASIDGIDPLYKESLGELDQGLNGKEKADLHSARDAALKSIHAFGRWLKAKLPSADPRFAMGEARYRYLLHHVLLLPLTPEAILSLGRSELARAGALEAWLSNPPVPPPASPPASQEAFLERIQSRVADLIAFIKENKVVTLPEYLGRFVIRPLPAAFKPAYPGGFMNPPGVYDTDQTGFYFAPAFVPGSLNFFIRSEMENPLPILGHEGIPGHFLQLSIANHLKDEIRRFHFDSVFVEGWAFYGEEMLDRLGLYKDDRRARLQVAELIRLRAARVAVDVNLATGKWTYEQAVNYLMREGGMDREAARGEAALAASVPGQKIDYLVGKWQIEHIESRYRILHPGNFTLKSFHDRLLSMGSIPLSLVAWKLLGDPSDYRMAESLGAKKN